MEQKVIYKGQKSKNASLILCLNNIYSGLHGQLKCLLKFINDYFALKRLNENQIANQILSIIVVKIGQILALKNLINSLGGELQIFWYRTNTLDYHLDKKRLSGNIKSKILIDQITCESLLIKECEKLIKFCFDGEVKSLLNTFIQDGKNNIDLIKGLNFEKNCQNSGKLQ